MDEHVSLTVLSHYRKGMNHPNYYSIAQDYLLPQMQGVFLHPRLHLPMFYARLRPGYGGELFGLADEWYNF